MDILREQLQDALSGIPGLKLIFLFGSLAFGSPRPDSDVDISERYLGDFRDFAFAMRRASSADH